MCCCTGNLKDEYGAAKFFCQVSEMSLFSELLSVLVVLFWAVSTFVLELVGALNESMSAIEHIKLLGSYLFLFALSIPQDKIVRNFREKRMISLEKKITHLQKKHPEREFHIQFINREDYLSQHLIPWEHAQPFLVSQIGFVVLYGISRLYIAQQQD